MMPKSKVKKILCTAFASVIFLSQANVSGLTAKAHPNLHKVLITGGSAAEDVLPSDMKLYGRLVYELNESGVTIIACAEDTKWIKLTGLIEGKPITRIADNAFSNCKYLTDIVIGDTVTYIGNNAFSDCKALKNVYAYSSMDAEPFIGEDVFKNCGKDLTLYCGLLSGWSTYAKDNDIKTVRNRKYCTDWEEPKHIYVPTTRADWLNRVKRVKFEPEDMPEIEFDITEDKDGYYFNRSGIYITKKDYIVLANCTANEYGANWVPVWEMALVPEVVFNMQARTGDLTIYDTVKPGIRFEGSASYIELEDFSRKVTDRVIYAVDLYLAYPDYFDEGYYQFRGDGVWNYFWGD